MSDSVRPHRWQPNRLPRPWDSPGKNTGVGCHFLLQCVKVKSEVKKSLFSTPQQPIPRLPLCFACSFHILGNSLLLAIVSPAKSLGFLSFLFKNLFIYFNWRIVTMQCCDGFCHVSIWIGYRHTWVPSLLNTPPNSLSTPLLQVVTEHQLCVSCIIHKTPTGYLFYIW